MSEQGDNKEEAPADDAQAAPDAGPQASEGSKVGSMKDGAYQVHILIETGKNMDLEGEDAVDPMIKVSFLANSKSTTAKSGITRTTQVKWDEHLFIDSPKLTEQEVSASMIEIEILNKGFFKSDSIGYFPISTPTIYMMNNHTLHNQMLAFTNPTADDKAKISGYVMVSI